MALKTSNVFDKDPNADLDYSVDWRENGWLAAAEDIVTSTWTVPTGLTGHNSSTDGDIAIIWLSGGTVGTKYTVINHIVTNTVPPRTDDRSIIINCRER